MLETKARSVVKAFSWRLIATLTTALLVYLMTGEGAIAISVGGMEVIAKFLLYYAHERLWQVVRFGKE